MKLHISSMLDAQKKHISFHTPGHKRWGYDITELSYSDCLLSPKGVLKEAEEDIAAILGARRSFLLTEGSTSGVFSMLLSLRDAGAKKIAAPIFSHPCVGHGISVFGLECVPIPQETSFGISRQPTPEAMREALSGADALLLTSPDYYGFLPALQAARDLCNEQGKPLLLDGAHGSHLHFVPEMYAGTYADLWVDGVHKSLPAMTQGAVVSAKNAKWAGRLEDSVKKLRTTSPSYPIMASVELAVKFPRNEKIERAAALFKEKFGCVKNDDWTKLLVPFGARSGISEKFLEAKGVYPEFNDGNYLLFYLSPCTKLRHLKKLAKYLQTLVREEVSEGAPAGMVPMYAVKGEA